MKIYTKTGDKGETGLLGGDRVSKADIRIEAYGTLDELNAVIGLLCQKVSPQDRDSLRRIQWGLFTIGSHLAAGRSDKPLPLPILEAEEVRWLEDDIDRRQSEIPPMRHFILPGSCEVEAYTHLARTVCRRAERRLVALNAQEPINPLFIEYLNRLSDWFFVLGRHITYLLGAQEIPWIPEKVKQNPA
ncbi:MAG: cob(I)yrinic acid a,c-diamide adenosyltransferase [Bacteroidia bacterium]|nr:cob(I)yrinic acid a,c-diamide adenosyltransferase [Bacteroidia bacterium]MCX7651945.1 cob(I)yrinic acid a,c-diamide adenosyltransferase [Bacteroidia bacterium]MDW8416096.1 cob(I)yrinic acid a,c-diamide adenosyltransferase [Bacteroidia bacterium]